MISAWPRQVRVLTNSIVLNHDAAVLWIKIRKSAKPRQDSLLRTFMCRSRESINHSYTQPILNNEVISSLTNGSNTCGCQVPGSSPGGLRTTMTGHPRTYSVTAARQAHNLEEDWSSTPPTITRPLGWLTGACARGASRSSASPGHA